MAVHPSDLDEGASLAALDLEKLACVPQLWLPQTQKLGRFSNCPLACKKNARLSVAFRVCDSGGLMCVSVWSSVLLPARSVRARVASRVCDLVNFARVRLVCGVCVCACALPEWVRVCVSCACGVCLCVRGPVCMGVVSACVHVWCGCVWECGAESLLVACSLLGGVFSPPISMSLFCCSFLFR